MAGKNRGKLGIRASRHVPICQEIGEAAPIPICQKIGEASPISISTRPDPIFVEILSPSRYLAHGWCQVFGLFTASFSSGPGLRAEPCTRSSSSWLHACYVVDCECIRDSWVGPFGVRFTKVLGASTQASTNEKLAYPQFLVTGHCLNKSLPCSCSPAGSSGSGLGCWSRRASSSGWRSFARSSIRPRCIRRPSNTRRRSFGGWTYLSFTFSLSFSFNNFFRWWRNEGVWKKK